MGEPAGGGYYIPALGAVSPIEGVWIRTHSFEAFLYSHYAYSLPTRGRGSSQPREVSLVRLCFLPVLRGDPDGKEGDCITTPMRFADKLPIGDGVKLVKNLPI